jgi:hypothetical protein
LRPLPGAATVALQINILIYLRIPAMPVRTRPLPPGGPGVSRAPLDLAAVALVWSAATASAAAVSASTVAQVPDGYVAPAVPVLLAAWWFLLYIVAVRLVREAAVRRKQHDRQSRSPATPVALPVPVAGQGQFPTFPSVFYLDRLREVKHKARILDTYSNLLADPAPASRRALVDALRSIALAGADVEIVLLDAEASVIGLRVEALGGGASSTAYRECIEDNLRELYVLGEELRHSGALGAFRVKLIDSLPGITCYQCDEYILTTFYPLIRRADQTPQSWVSADSRAGRFVSETFEKLWQRGGDLADLLFCEMRFGVADGVSEPVRPRTPFITLDSAQGGGGSSVYLSITDPEIAELTTSREFEVRGLPDEAGIRQPMLCRARAVDDEESLLRAEVANAMQLKYGGAVDEEDDDTGEIYIEIIDAELVPS